jgi:hypothetical protein
MAKATPELISALRRAADKIEKKDKYQWGHMGNCNCGHLAQELTNYVSAEIHRIAMQRSGDWNDQCEDYCDSSKLPIDMLISDLLSKGLQIEDLMKLERLSDPEILAKVRGSVSFLEKNNKSHVAIYLNAWADLLEDTYLQQTDLPELDIEKPEDLFIVK